MTIKQKLSNIIWPVIYLLLAAMVIGSFSFGFRSYYFTPIYVSGSSMQPTLNKIDEGPQWHHYGYVDSHKHAIDNLKRFNIVTTYYPFTYSNDYEKPYDPNGENVVSDRATFKIKRVYAFPGEYFKFTVETDPVTKVDDVKFYVKDSAEEPWGDPLDLPFERNIKIDRNNNPNYYEYESPQLGENEYFVMGDNYEVSADCYSETQTRGKFQPIYYENIQGVLIAIEGICKVTTASGEVAGIIKNFLQYTKKVYPTPIYFI